MKRRSFIALLSALPFMAKAKPVETVSIEAGTGLIDEVAKLKDSQIDMVLYGNSFSQDGKRVPPEDVYLTQVDVDTVARKDYQEMMNKRANGLIPVGGMVIITKGTKIPNGYIEHEEQPKKYIGLARIIRRVR